MNRRSTRLGMQQDPTQGLLMYVIKESRPLAINPLLGYSPRSGQICKESPRLTSSTQSD